jgi:hypothetical protein
VTQPEVLLTAEQQKRQVVAGRGLPSRIDPQPDVLLTEEQQRALEEERRQAARKLPFTRNLTAWALAPDNFVFRDKQSGCLLYPDGEPVAHRGGHPCSQAAATCTPCASKSSRGAGCHAPRRPCRAADSLHTTPQLKGPAAPCPASTLPQAPRRPPRDGRRTGARPSCTTPSRCPDGRPPALAALHTRVRRCAAACASLRTGSASSFTPGRRRARRRRSTCWARATS